MLLQTSPPQLQCNLVDLTLITDATEVSNQSLMSGWYLFNFFFQKEETDIGVDGEDEDQNGRPYDKFDNCSCLKDDQFLLQVQ